MLASECIQDYCYLDKYSWVVRNFQSILIFNIAVFLHPTITMDYEMLVPEPTPKGKKTKAKPTPVLAKGKKLKAEPTPSLAKVKAPITKPTDKSTVEPNIAETLDNVVIEEPRKEASTSCNSMSQQARTS
jgi:hypothetical protein